MSTVVLIALVVVGLVVYAVAGWRHRIDAAANSPSTTPGDTSMPIRIILALLLFTCLPVSATGGERRVVSKQELELPEYTVDREYGRYREQYPDIRPAREHRATGIFRHTDLVYSVDGPRVLHLDLFQPAGSAAPVPAVILVHGGGWRSGDRSHQVPLAQALAAAGYAAITVEYRLSAEALYPAGVLDIQRAIRWVKRHSSDYGIDPQRIALLGASSGAHMATLIGSLGEGAPAGDGGDGEDGIDSRVQAVINLDGVVNLLSPEALKFEDKPDKVSFMALWLGGRSGELPDLWREVSPLQHAGPHTPPTLFVNSAHPRFHVGRDEYIAILQDAGTYTEVHTIPDTPHTFWLFQPWFDQTRDLVIGFLDRVFYDGQAPGPKRAASPGYETAFTVALDGSGDFTLIQEAIYAAKTFPWTPITIYLRDGVYEEKVNVYAWNTRLSLIGESREGTIIRFGDHFDRIDRGRNSTFHTYTLRVAGNDFHAENLTIENTAGPVGQAVALHVEADRVSIVNTSIRGYQDTLYVAGEGHRSYFRDCYIEGSIDFIFGQGTALFENCELRSLGDSYITAASTPAREHFGLVFRDCTLSAADGVGEVYLGRPWRRHARTVFMNSHLGSHIVPAGWHNWDNVANESTAMYAEYHNDGPGAQPGARVSWARQLTDEEAAEYSIDNIFRGWKPPR